MFSRSSSSLNARSMYGLAPPARSITLSLVLIMFTVSFRWFASSGVPSRNRRKQAVLGLTLLVLAGCGGSAAAKGHIVRGTGFTFVAPADWTVARKGAEVQVAQGTSLLSVTLFPLLRRFRSELWAKVIPELDQAAADVARQ